MPEIGLGKLIVIALVALIVFGPDRLPGIMRRMGKALSAFRTEGQRAMGELRGAVEPLQQPPVTDTPRLQPFEPSPEPASEQTAKNGKSTTPRKRTSAKSAKSRTSAARTSGKNPKSTTARKSNAAKTAKNGARPRRTTPAAAPDVPVYPPTEDT